MGNCLRRESSMQWGGDDWGSPVPEEDGFLMTSSSYMKHEILQGKNIIDAEEEEEEEEGLLAGKKLGLFRSSTTASSTEIKIKITKKQLEELLGRVNMKELSIEQVLSELMNVSQRSIETHDRSWRPNLQSIPE